MTQEDIKNKNLVLCDFIHDLTNYKVRAEYSTSNRDNEKVIVVQEQSGAKIVFFDNPPLYNYYNIEIFMYAIFFNNFCGVYSRFRCSKTNFLSRLF